jgi:hypothetical protein
MSSLKQSDPRPASDSPGDCDQTTQQTRSGGIAYRLRASFGDAVEDRLLAEVVREPRVAECQYPIQHGGPVAANENRWVRPLGRLGIRPDALEVDELAGVTGLMLGPDRLDGLDALP